MNFQDSLLSPKNFAASAAALWALLSCWSPSPARAAGIGGYYETEVSARETSDFRWNIGLPKHYFQMKFHAAPARGLDLYSQLSARTNEPWNEKDIFAFERGWGKWWFGSGELYFLVGEERHWIDSPLLKISDQWKASHFNSGSGIRVNIFKAGPFSGGAFYTRNLPADRAEWYGSYYDEISEHSAARISADMRPSFGALERVAFGGTYLGARRLMHKYDGSGAYIASSSLVNEVASADARLFAGGASALVESAVSSKRGSANDPLEGESAVASAAEIRDVNINPLRFQGRIYDYGEGFRSELSRPFGRLARDGNDSDKEFGRRGYYGEASYLWPGKMITVTYKHSSWQSDFDYLTGNQNIRDDYIIFRSTEKYSYGYNAVESRVDFVNGIRAAAAAEASRGRYGSWPGASVEISGDTRDVYSRVQMRVKDIGSSSGYGQRRVLGAEVRYNLSERTQLYARGVAVDAPKTGKNWSSMFYQFRYFVGWDTECYVEYGDGWHTDSLAYDADITDSERVVASVLKLLLKINF
jgi:hypothetical protein